MKLLKQLLLACALVSPFIAHAAAPMAKSQAPGYYRAALGDFEITVLICSEI